MGSTTRLRRNQARIQVDMTEVDRPTRVRPKAPAALAMLTAFALVANSVPVRAQGDLPGGMPFIRDAEIEQLLRDYTQPILKVAGLAQQNVHVVIINER